MYYYSKMDSNSSISLTLNGVLYLSLGFKQHFQLQVLSQKVGEQSELQLVLYDGLAYIGAVYYPRMGEEEGNQEVRERDVVKIYPLSAVRNQPVILESLQIISSPLEQFLGREIISLQELMRRKSKTSKPFPNPHKIEDTQPRKILKTSTSQAKLQPQSKIIFEDQPQNIYQQPQKSSICSSKQQQTSNTLAINKQSNAFKPIQSVQTQKTNLMRENPVSVEIDSNDEIVEEILTQKKMNVNKQPQYVYQISSQDEPISFNIAEKNRRNERQSIPQCQKGEAQSLHIRDLYERMHRFEIQCRINYLTTFTSQKGSKCVRFVAIDSLGDEVICVLFENHNHNMNEIKLNRGKTYVFKNGEVENRENGLTILLPWNGISESNKNIPSFLPQRMMRAGQIQRKLSVFMDRSAPSDISKTGNKNQEYNISGIFMGFKQNPKIIKNGFRVTGTLCDPDQRVCVIFSMVADELSSFPTEGTVVSLHNFIIIEEDRIIRLESSRKGYIIDQTYNYHEYFSDLKQASASGEWKRMDLRNISQVTYTHRNIGQLRRLMSRTIDFQQIYSEFDCFITNIIEKIKYSGCVVCRKAMKQQIGPLSYCLSCKKPQPSVTRFIFQIQIADSTGSIDIIYSRDQLEQLFGMTLEQYASYDEQQRKYYLQLIRYKCIVIRLKSERVTGGEKHQGVLISRLIAQRSLQQIKDLAIEEKTNFSRSF